MKVIAHRGASWVYPENTLPAFQAAIEDGADLVELDFHTTADGALVCVHDATLDRYLAGRHLELTGVPVNQLRLEQIRAVDVGRWKEAQFAGTEIPTLEEALELLAGTGQRSLSLIEQKTGTVAQLLEVLDRQPVAQRVVVQSFDWGFLRQLRAERPEIAIAALGSGPIPPGRLEQILALRPVAVHWDAWHLCSTAVGHLHAAEQQVWAWTVDTEMAFRGAAVMGMDGITTNRCEFAREVVSSMAQAGACATRPAQW